MYRALWTAFVLGWLGLCPAGGAEGPRREGREDPAAAQRHYLRKRQVPGSSLVPTERLLLARERLRGRTRFTSSRPRKLESAGPAAAGSIPGDWTFLGPGNVGGRTRAIVLAPQPNADGRRTMWAAGVTGGIWKSLDEGRSWRPLDDLLPSSRGTARVRRSRTGTGRTTGSSAAPRVSWRASCCASR